MANNGDKIEIRHPNGDTTEIDDCFVKVMGYCHQVAAYEAYDKLQVQQAHGLSAFDILLASNIGANLSGEDFMQLWRKREEIGRRLAEIPTTLDLADKSLSDEDLWESLKKLFEVCRCKGVSYSKMTKILHKKRPRLIPIVDNDVVAYKYLDDSWLVLQPHFLF